MIFAIAHLKTGIEQTRTRRVTDDPCTGAVGENIASGPKISITAEGKLQKPGQSRQVRPAKNGQLVRGAWLVTVSIRTTEWRLGRERGHETNPGQKSKRFEGQVFSVAYAIRLTCTKASGLTACGRVRRRLFCKLASHNTSVWCVQRVRIHLWHADS